MHAIFRVTTMCTEMNTPISVIYTDIAFPV